MLRFSANISTLLQEVPLIERIKLAADAGFDGIEIQFPYDENPDALTQEYAIQLVTEPVNTITIFIIYI